MSGWFIGGRYSTLIPLVLLIALTPLIGNDVVTLLFMNSLIFGTLVSSLDIAVGYIGLLNFGYAASFGIGAYTSGMGTVYRGISPWLGIFICAAVSGALGTAVGFISARSNGICFAMLTWFLAEALQHVYYLILVMSLLILYFSFRVVQSKVGLALAKDILVCPSGSKGGTMS